MGITQAIVNKVVVSVAALLIIVAFGFGSMHVYNDHQELHFNSQMLEAVRQAVVQMHPNLADGPATGAVATETAPEAAPSVEEAP